MVSGDSLPALDAGPDSLAVAGLLPLRAGSLPTTSPVASLPRRLRSPRGLLLPPLTV